MVCDVHSLPNEVLVQIFSFLDPCAKVNASSTCRRWMHVMNGYPELFDDIRVNVKQFRETYIPLTNYSILTRKFNYFHFPNTIFNKKLLRFLRKNAAQFRRLSFDRCSIVEKDFLESNKKNHGCTNLQVLEMWGVNICVLFGNLPKLKKLHINMEMASGFSDEDMVHVQKMAPLTLTEFGISSHIVSDRRIIKRYYNDETMFKTKPVGVFLSYLAVEDFIRKRCSTLQTLDFSGSNISDKALMVLMKMEGLRLKALKLAICFGLISSVPIFCKNQLGIVTLNLKGVLVLDDQSVEEICTTLPQLEDLDLTHCGILNVSVVKIFQLKRLRKLNLTSCSHITPESFSDAIDKLACHNLKCLSLCATAITDQLLSRLLPLVPGLRELDLNSCKIENFGVSAIVRNLSSLRLLNLSCCKRISDEGLMGLYEGLETVSVPLSNIKTLEELCLKDCKSLTEEGLVQAIRFPRLISLNVAGCEPLKEDVIAMLKDYNPNLRHFTYNNVGIFSLNKCI